MGKSSLENENSNTPAAPADGGTVETWLLLNFLRSCRIEDQEDAHMFGAQRCDIRAKVHANDELVHRRMLELQAHLREADSSLVRRVNYLA